MFKIKSGEYNFTHAVYFNFNCVFKKKMCVTGNQFGSE